MVPLRSLDEVLAFIFAYIKCFCAFSPTRVNFSKYGEVDNHACEEESPLRNPRPVTTYLAVTRAIATLNPTLPYPKPLI